MNSARNKTRLAEKRYGDKLEKIKKKLQEIRKSMKNKMTKVKNLGRV